MKVAHCMHSLSRISLAQCRPMHRAGMVCRGLKSQAGHDTLSSCFLCKMPPSHLAWMVWFHKGLLKQDEMGGLSVNARNKMRGFEVPMQAAE